MTRSVMFLAALFTLVALEGCGGGTNKIMVKGTVALAGKPITYGMVKFFQADQQVGSAMIHSDGTFEASDMPLGVVAASVDTRDQTQMVMMGKGGAKTSGAAGPGGDKKAPPVASPIPGGVSPETIAANKIPMIYADPKTSKLSYTITGKNQVIAIELK